MPAGDRKKKTTPATDSPKVAQLKRERRAEERKLALAEHLVDVEQGRRRRLTTITQDVYLVGVARDGGPTIRGERVTLNDGKTKAGQPVRRPILADSDLAKAIFNLSDKKPARLSPSRTKKLNTILQPYGLRVEERGGVLVLSWRPDARSRLTPVLRRAPAHVSAEDTKTQDRTSSTQPAWRSRSRWPWT